MGTLSLNDLKYLFFGGGQDQEYVFYEEANDRGITAETLLELPSIVSPRVALRLPGATTTYASTPDNAAFTPTATLDLRVTFALNDWTPATDQTVLCQWNSSGDQRAWALRVESAFPGRLGFQSCSDGASGTVAQATSSAVVGATDGHWISVRVAWNQAADSVTFYTRPAGTDLSIEEGWTQLGNVITGASVAGSIFNSSAAITLGATAAESNPLTGLIDSAYINVDGTVVAHPKFDGPIGPRVTDESGKTWTLNGSTWSWQRVTAPLS